MTALSALALIAAALLGLCTTHMNDEIRLRAQRKLDRWFPLGR